MLFRGEKMMTLLGLITLVRRKVMSWTLQQFAENSTDVLDCKCLEVTKDIRANTSPIRWVASLIDCFKLNLTHLPEAIQEVQG